MFLISFLKLHLFILTLYGLIFNSAALCQKGQRVIRGKNPGCEDCIDGYFQDTENDSQYCKVCRKCDKESGSDVALPCSKVSNTICKCRTGFVESDNDFSTCQCKAGFGKKSGECTECEYGHFSKSINSRCQTWKQCKFGVNITGTKTSDVICNGMKHTGANASPTPGRAVSTGQPRVRVQIQKLLTTAAAATTTTPRRIPHSDTTSPSGTADPVGFLVTFATVGLLMLVAVIIKLYIIFYLEKHESVQKPESTCGRPVEEIGGSEVCLKLTLEEN